MIHIDDHIRDFNLEEALALVSPQRREYALRYRHEHDQRLCVAAYRLLMHALHQEYGINESVRFIYDRNGKPMLEGHPEIHFSMSHCAHAVAVVLSDTPAGIDIETLDHYSEDIASRVMNEEEMCHIMSSPNPAMAFTRLWTMKESLYKLTGDDNGGNIPQMLTDSASYRFTTVSHPSYITTVCQKKQS